MVKGFEELRKNLLKRLVSFYTGNQEEDKIQMEKELGDEFKRNFNELIEKCILSLMEGEDNFFGLFMIRTKRKISFDIEWPIATEIELSNFIMYFNPWKFLNCSFEEMKALIKHEIYHIMYGHHARAQRLNDSYGKLATNLAMDVSVNQYIKNLPGWAVKLDNVSLSYNIELKEEQTMEKYAELIHEAIEKIKREAPDKKIELNNNELEFDMEKLHDSWNNKNNINLEDMKGIIDKVAKDSYKGKAPKGMEEILSALNRVPEISWKDYLKNILPSMPYGYKRTITRKNRRQPDRFDLRGTLREHVAQILVAIDISGSITDKEIEQIFTEIFSLIRNREAEITVIECDDKVRRVYKVKSKRDLKPRLDKRGGTAFSPVFEYINKKGLRNHLLVYFTDGLGEEELSIKPINYKTLWILTGKEEEFSLKKPYGEIKTLKQKSGQKVDKTYGLKVMREMLHDWAR